MGELQTRQLEVFLSVARHLHFGRAGDELYLSQPTVSQAIRRLERELGGTLFTRSTRRVTLTPLGEMFVGEARQALATIEAAYDRGREFAARGTRQFWIGCGVNSGPDIIQMIPMLRDVCPDVVFEIKEMRTIDQVAALADGTIDACVGWFPDVDATIATMPIGQPTTMIAIVAENHPLACRDSLTLADVAAEPIVIHPRRSNPRVYDLLIDWISAGNPQHLLVETTAGPVGIAMRALQGDAIGVAFEFLFRYFPIAGARFIPLVGAPVIQRTAFWRQGDRRPALGALLNALRSADRAAASGNSAPAPA